MKFEIDSENYKEFTPFGWGILATLIWSVVLCSYSAVSGQLGNAPGIMIWPWLIGSISRYYDPFILGMLVSFTIWAWKHSPVPWEKVNNEDRYITSSLLGIIGFSASLAALYKVEPNASSLYILLLFLVVMLLTPFGFRATLIPFIAISLLFWTYKGLAIVAITLPLLWIGKGVIWWAVNIVRYWSFDRAYNKLKGRPLEGTPTAEGVPASAT